MSTRMLIDARHPEETRVTVVKGSRVEEFDYESASKRPLKGNIYLARVTRVEPSLQAAFVEYGGNRHGFLAFSEIHPDYYQIPVEDRQELIEAETKAALERAKQLDADLEAEAEAEEKAKAEKKKRRGRRRRKAKAEDAATDIDAVKEADAPAEAPADAADAKAPDADAAADASEGTPADADAPETASEAAAEDAAEESAEDAPAKAKADDSSEDAGDDAGTEEAASNDDEADAKESDEADKDAEIAEAAARRQALRALKRRYNIQEVIKRRQVLLVQVVKEERGNKGAALTTYLSLAGRYCVLMPNSTHSGGISRKISSASDRRNLKKIINALEVPDEMGLIVRTAGMERTKTEIKRDYDYLLRLWNGIRDLTLKSVAPTLVYEEGNLIKRTIRDLYTRDIDEILVEGEDGYKAAKEFMKLLMPSHAKKVQNYKDSIPLFHRYQVESHLEAMYQPIVQLRSGGYIVINPTEALISIDVNSGRATKEHNIEETALKTNLEAAEEVARQLRLRDMAGLVVIDFIDMEERSNNRSVERRMKEVLKSDRARIQVGRISSFGLMEMSRQRLRSNLLEVSMETCKACAGTGIVRSVESAALMTLRNLEEEGIRGRSSVVRVATSPDVAIYLLNKKRSILSEFEAKYHFEIEILAQPSMGPSDIEITREARTDQKAGTSDQAVKPDTEPADLPSETEQTAASDDDDRPARKRRRRRRRRRGGGEDRADQPQAAEAAEDATSGDEAPTAEAADGDEDQERKPRRRRGSRGGRRRADRTKAEAADSVESTEAVASDEAASETAEEQPKRRRRVKKTDDAAVAEEATSTEASAEAPADNAGKDTATADAEAEKPAAKPRRTRRKKAETAEGAAAEAGPAEAASDEKPAPKRRTRKAAPKADAEADNGEAPKKPRTRSKKAADKAAESAETDGKTGGADSEKAEKAPAKKPARSRAKKAADDQPKEAISQPEEAPAAAATAADDGEAKPKKQGWWNRTFG